MSNKKKNGRNSLNSKRLGIVLADIQLVITIIFLGLIFILNILPTKYLVPTVIILLLLELFAFLSQMIGKRKLRKAGKIVSVIVCLILSMGCYYLYKAQITISDISGAEVKVHEMSFVVLEGDPAKSIQEAKDYTFGIQETIDMENTSKAIEGINEELEAEVNVKTYDSLDNQISALYNGEVQVIVINEAYRENISELYPDFTDETRILSSKKIETIVEVEKSDKIVTEDPFTVYISGIDAEGSISKTSRSDVNIIATINPKTKQILLTSTPRDYYVELPEVSRGQKDKLTHAGIYGVDVSIDTLEAVYGIEIDYYVKVNFTGFVNIVDALGGITVDSDYTFTSDWGPSFQKGENKINGEEALAFSRERHAFSDGDNQRGKNHMKIIMGIIDKATSPAIITNYNSVMGSVAGSFETNMSSGEITSLVKMQMGDMASWNIVSDSVSGANSSGKCYSTGSQSLYVMIPDEISIQAAKDKMAEVRTGEVLAAETEQ